MAQPRVALGDVNAIYLSTADLTPFINAAHLIVEQHLLDCGHDENVLFEIERWLAAHFASLASNGDPATGNAKSLKEGDLSITYASDFGEHLKSTAYGQQAILFDTCGILDKIGKHDIKFLGL